MKKKQIVPPVQFYNEIALVYDTHLDTIKDKTVRDEVAAYFSSSVLTGKVLDFGGGTGLDLPWLLADGYDVYFCEPAEKMREVAQSRAQIYNQRKQPFFLPTDKTNYQAWNSLNLPLAEKLNGILANFGVLNYINNLPLLFENFSFLLEEKGSVIINLLYASPQKLFSKYLKNTLKAILKGERVKSGSSYRDVAHETTLYSLSKIRKASSKYFVLKKYKPLGKNSDFLLIHLVKK